MPSARVIGPNGSRDVPVEDIAQGPGKSTLAKGELGGNRSYCRPGLTHAGDAYLRFIPRTEMDIAVVGCGVNLVLDASGTCTHARVALGAVAARVFLVPEAADALVGTKVDDAALEALAAACSPQQPSPD